MKIDSVTIVSSSKRRTKLKNLLREIIRNRTIYIFLLPALISVVVFNYRPMVGVVMAFQDFTPKGGLFNSPWVGLKHFIKFLTNPDFYSALKNTLSINFLGLLIGFPMPIILAIMLNELRPGKYKKFSQTVSYLPHFISWVIIAGMMYKLLNYDAGSLNILIRSLGGQPIDFLKRIDFFWPILISLTIWKELGWNSIIYLASISSIDQELYEAASVDGASRLRKLFSITLPGIAPTIGLLLILSAGNLVMHGGASFDAVFNLRNAYVADAANVLDYYTYREGVYYRNFSYATAIGLALSFTSLLLVLGANRLSRKFRGYGAF